MEGWVKDYIGIPFADTDADKRSGCNCWGLVRLVYRERRGIFLPSLEEHYEGVRDYANIDLLVKRETSTCWSQIAIPEVFDVLVTRYGRAHGHVGICLDNRYFLHTVEGRMVEGKPEPSYSRYDDFTGWKWTKLTVGFFRYKEIG